MGWDARYILDRCQDIFYIVVSAYANEVENLWQPKTVFHESHIHNFEKGSLPNYSQLRSQLFERFLVTLYDNLNTLEQMFFLHSLPI